LVRAGRIPKELFGEVFFLQNYVSHFWPHTWSLAVEEHFYFALPLLLLLLTRLFPGKSNPFRMIPLFSIVLGVLCLGMRIWVSEHGGGWGDVAHPTHLRMDALFAGVTLGYYSHFEPDSFREARHRWILAVGVVLTLTLFLLPSVPRLTFAYVAFCFIVAWATNQPSSKKYWVRLLSWAGYYSYSIYLWHVLALFFWDHLPGGWFRGPFYIASVIGLGILMSKLIEIPMLRIRDRWIPSRTRSSGFYETPPTSLKAATNGFEADTLAWSSAKGKQ
jgi:peptidoglycan/LPS O-acetylase OafA/YrhL